MVVLIFGRPIGEQVNGLDISSANHRDRLDVGLYVCVQTICDLELKVCLQRSGPRNWTCTRSHTA